MGMGWLQEGVKPRSASENLAASLGRGKNPFAWLLPLGRRAPVVSFDAIFAQKVLPGDATADEELDTGLTALGAHIEATRAGQVTSIPSRSPRRPSRPLEVSETVYVRIAAAHGLRSSVELDPYVVVRAGTQEWQTPAMANDSDPRWSVDNEFTFGMDPTVELLEMEVVDAGTSQSLGKAVLSLPDLCTGVLHRRRLPLETCGELSVEVRCDVAELVKLEPSGDQAPNATTSLRYFVAPERVPFEAPTPQGLQLSLPEDWEDEDSGDEAIIDFEQAAVVKARQPRQTFAAPADLFGDLRLEVEDPMGLAQRLQHRSETCKQALRGRSYFELASLREDMTMRSRETQNQSSEGDEAAMSKAQEAAVQKAVAKEKATERKAQEELQRFLRKMKELEATQAAAAEAAAARATSQESSEKSTPATDTAEVNLQRQPSFQPKTAVAAPPATAAPPVAPPKALAPPAPPAKVQPMGAERPTPLAPAPESLAQPKAKAAEVGAQDPPQDRFAAAMTKLAKAENELSEFKKDAGSKDFRMEVKKLINTRFGQISATWNRIQECTSALCGILSKHSQDPEIRRTYVAHAMAARLADDAEVSVRSQPRAAWSIAEVSCRIFDKSPAVQELFIGLMCRNCPHLRADFSAQGQRDLAATKRPQEGFTEMVDRLVSYQRLWNVIFTTQGDLGVIWNWLARALNHSPSTATVAMIHGTLDMVGADLQARYKKQFHKLIVYIDGRYMEEVTMLQSNVKGEEADRLRASHSRLSRWLQDFKVTGRAVPPEGRKIHARQESELNPNI